MSNSGVMAEVLGAVPGIIPTGLSALRGFRLNNYAGLNALANVSDTPIWIGSFQLQGFEAPQHLNVGGQQKLAVHDFPGGIRTVQSLGAFPPEEISWEGIFLGSDAWSRAYELDLLRVKGAAVDLVFGSWGYTGKIRHLEIIVRHEWLCRYRIFYIPITDLATPPTQTQSPSSTQTVTQSVSTLSQNNPNTVFGGTLPVSLSTAVSSLTSSVAVALNNAGGVFSSITSAAGSEIKGFAAQISSQVSNVLGTSSASPVDTAGALLVGANATNIANQVSVAPTIRNSVVLNNPNLMQLSAQYYGDASLWPSIASANNLTDPMPVGTYTINIPTGGGG